MTSRTTAAKADNILTAISSIHTPSDGTKLTGATKLRLYSGKLLVSLKGNASDTRVKTQKFCVILLNSWVKYSTLSVG